MEVRLDRTIHSDSVKLSCRQGSFLFAAHMMSMQISVRRLVEMKRFLLHALFVVVGLSALTILFLGGRQALTKIQVAREWQAAPTSIPALETTTRLEILPLYEEDRADDRFDFGHGVSYLIRTDLATVLLDLGHNPNESAGLPSLQNMQTLGID
jgi:hypothetical protein